jgi:cation diffusion facilitator CzcD-associated flavoprotein CzcO
VLIIGAGFGGIGAGVELTRKASTTSSFIDKNAGIGGTWWANTYPGVAVDIPSIYYSFSYEPPKDWSRVFAPGAEVQKYAEQVVDSVQPAVPNSTEYQDHRRQLGRSEPHLAHRPGVRRAADMSLRDRRRRRARAAADCHDIHGIDSFGGKIVHTALWDHDFDYSGKRIAVIGTGATALQLIPEMADVASHLTVFQRTPIWVAPKPDAKIPAAVSGHTAAHQSGPQGYSRRRQPSVSTSDSPEIGVFHDKVPGLAGAMTKGGAAGYRAWLRGNPELVEQLTLLVRAGLQTAVVVESVPQDVHPGPTST